MPEKPLRNQVAVVAGRPGHLPHAGSGGRHRLLHRAEPAGAARCIVTLTDLLAVFGISP